MISLPLTLSLCMIDMMPVWKAIYLWGLGLCIVASKRKPGWKVIITTGVCLRLCKGHIYGPWDYFCILTTTTHHRVTAAQPQPLCIWRAVFDFSRSRQQTDCFRCFECCPNVLNAPHHTSAISSLRVFQGKSCNAMHRFCPTVMPIFVPAKLKVWWNA